MRYKTKSQKVEETITVDDILSQREHRLLLEGIQQQRWEDSGRDWKKYLSSIEWDELRELPPKIKEKSHPFEKFIL